MVGWRPFRNSCFLVSARLGYRPLSAPGPLDYLPRGTHRPSPAETRCHTHCRTRTLLALQPSLQPSSPRQRGTCLGMGLPYLSFQAYHRRVVGRRSWQSSLRYRSEISTRPRAGPAAAAGAGVRAIAHCTNNDVSVLKCSTTLRTYTPTAKRQPAGAAASSSHISFARSCAHVRACARACGATASKPLSPPYQGHAATCATVRDRAGTRVGGATTPSPTPAAQLISAVYVLAPCVASGTPQITRTTLAQEHRKHTEAAPPPIDVARCGGGAPPPSADGVPGLGARPRRRQRRAPRSALRAGDASSCARQRRGS